MKIFILSLLIAFFAAYVTAEVDENGLELDNIGVRILLNKGREVTGLSCEEDSGEITEALGAAFERRNLRVNRELQNCRVVCEGKICRVSGIPMNTRNLHGLCHSFNFC